MLTLDHPELERLLEECNMSLAEFIEAAMPLARMRPPKNNMTKLGEDIFGMLKNIVEEQKTPVASLPPNMPPVHTGDIGRFVENPYKVETPPEAKTQTSLLSPKSFSTYPFESKGESIQNWSSTREVVHAQPRLLDVPCEEFPFSSAKPIEGWLVSKKTQAPKKNRSDFLRPLNSLDTPTTTLLEDFRAKA
jgi:hypothetical protein